MGFHSALAHGSSLVVGAGLVVAQSLEPIDLALKRREGHALQLRDPCFEAGSLPLELGELCLRARDFTLGPTAQPQLRLKRSIAVEPVRRDALDSVNVDLSFLDIVSKRRLLLSKL